MAGRPYPGASSTSTYRAVASALTTSARRFPFKVKESRPEEVDAELQGWLRHTYDLSS